MSKLNAWDKVVLSRMVERPTTLDLIERIFTDFIELKGDRNFRDDKAIVGGIGFLEEIPVTVIGVQKGKDLKENIEGNFGAPYPEGYRKALRLMKNAEKFNRPIINFINTAGAFCGIGAEERGQGEAIARNLLEMSKLKTPVISIVIGEGGSGGALALAVADRVWMLENAVYSILSPEGFASILWKDGTRAKEAAESMKMTADSLFKLGIIDKVIKEPNGGAHKDVDLVAQRIKDELYKELKKLIKVDKSNLIRDRYAKFRSFGEFDIL